MRSFISIFLLHKSRWIAFLLVLIHLLLRLIAIDERPAFFDESFHVDYAGRIWQFDEHPATFAHGKVLLYYYFGLFHHENQQLMLPAARIAIALWSCVIIAGIYRLGKNWGDGRTGLLAMVCYLIFPLALTHERMALADPLATGFLVLLIWQGERYVQHPTIRRSIIVGILLSLTILSKLTVGLSILIVPLMTLLATRGNWRLWWSKYAKGLAIITAITGLPWIPLVLPFFQPQTGQLVLVSATSVREIDGNLFNSVRVSLQIAADMLRDFLTLEALLVLVVMLVIGLVQKHTRYAGSILLIWFGLALLPLIGATYPAVRYLTPLAPAFALLAALTLTEMRSPLGRAATTIAIGFWIITYAIPFTDTLLNRPTELAFQSLHNFRTYQSGQFNLGTEIQHAMDIRENHPHLVTFADWYLCYSLHMIGPDRVTCLDETRPQADLETQLRTSSDPSFLLISLTPQLWEARGLTYSVLAEIPIDGIQVTAIYVVQIYPQRAG